MSSPQGECTLTLKVSELLENVLEILRYRYTKKDLCTGPSKSLLKKELFLSSDQMNNIFIFFNNVIKN